MTSTLLTPAPHSRVGCTPLMWSSPQTSELPTCRDRRETVVPACRGVSCDLPPGVWYLVRCRIIAVLGLPLVGVECRKVDGANCIHCLCKTQHFQASSEALRRISTSMSLRLLNPAMRLKTDSCEPHSCGSYEGFWLADRHTSCKTCPLTAVPAHSEALHGSVSGI